MRMLHWCVLAVTILLLVCEVTISQLCKSLITMVDGFHTLFILMCMVVPPPPPSPCPQTASIIKPQHSSVDFPASPPRNCSSSARPPPTLHADSPIKPLPGTQTSTAGPSGPNQPPDPQPSHEAASLVNTHHVSWSEASPPALACGVSYTNSRIQPVGAFLSTLLLASLCISYLIKIISFSLHPHPLQRPLMLVLVGAVSLLHKMLLLRLNWDQQRDERFRVHKPPETEAHIEVNHRVRNGQNACQTSSVCESSRHIESPVPSSRRPVCLPSITLVVQGLFTALLALTNSLATFLIGPQDLHSAGVYKLLVYLDPALSLLAVIMLMATVRPQMCRYGLLLLQATPPHVCTAELEQRIASVPGVQAVHDLHIWQLAESLTVASVHIHCSAKLAVHRCAHLMSEVTNVLQSVGVSCCTIQPEFTSCATSTAGCECDASPVVHREDPSLPPLLACSLACGRACAGSMCCSPHEEESRSLLSPPAGETKDEPPTLVIENTFL